MPEYYRYVLIQTYRARGEQSKQTMRARPLPGQELPISMRVECSSKMRNSHPEGTVFKVLAKIKSTERDPHLYTSWQWAYEIFSEIEAADFIRAKKWNASAPYSS